MIKDWWWRFRANYSARNALIWFLTNGFLVGLLVLGGFYGKTWAGNIFSFLCVVFFVLNFLVALLPNQQIKGDKRSIPDAISVPLNLFVVLTLAGLGWFVLASFQLLSTLSSQIKWRRVDQLNKPEPDVIEAEFIDVPDEKSLNK